MKLRSLLFAPGDSERKAEKALASEADGVIIDLEDSVAPAGKPGARERMVAAPARRNRARAGSSGSTRSAREWYLADVVAAVAARRGGGAAAQMHRAARSRGAAPPSGGAGEPGRAAGRRHRRARARHRDGRVAAGARLSRGRHGCSRSASGRRISRPISASRRAAPQGAYPAAIVAARAATLVAAAAAGVAALDTPWPDPRDPDGLLREAAASATDGFAGKLCIHPAQIAPVNAAFTPAPERLAWARMVRDAFAADPGAGVLALEGKMIDRPHLRLAERILAAID